MAMHHRFHRDIINNNNSTTDDITNNNDDWWNELHSRVDFKESIVCHYDTSHNSTGDDDDTKEVPTAFQSPSGRHHLLAVMEACDVSRGRAVQLTFTALLSVMEEDPSHDFATSNATTTSNSNEEEEERAATLLTRHLGSRTLYERCVSIYKLSYLERVRVVLECLRLDQEGRANNVDNVNNNNDDVVGGISEVTKYLNTIDSYYTYKSENKMNKRGILVFLLRLVGSPLPRVFFTANHHHHHDQTAMSYNASQLSSDNNSSSYTNKSYWDHDNDTIVALSIRKEALEALLLLLYDRLEGGVHRYDVALLLECALLSSSSTFAVSGNDGGNAIEYLEFGMTSSDYLKSGTFQNTSSVVGGSNNHHRRDWILSDTTTTTTTSATAESTRQTVNELKLALNGLWGLLFGECMGLWRATTANDDNGTATDDWRKSHPLFSGLANNNFLSLEDNDNGRNTTNTDTPNLGLTGRNLGLAIQEDTDEGSTMREAQKELEWLYRKLVFAGETLRDRRRVAYKSRSRRVKEGDCNDEDDDELWGVQAPEGVALLSFGLLLQLLVGTSCNDGAEENEFITELSKWGQACTSMANDDCAAFAYLERVLNGVVVNPLEGVRDRLSTRLGTGNGGGAEIVRVIAGRREITMLADGDSMALTDGEGAITGLPVDASSVVYSSIGREILSATIRVFKKSLLSLQSSSAVDNIGMLVDLAAIIYRHSAPLCDQFWSDWNEFSSAMTDDEGTSPNSSDEAMCFLLETAHNLATATLAELESGSRQEAIIKYLRPMSSFLHLISSLCPSSLVVHNVLDSGFLPDGLVSKTVSLCSALAPMASSLNESNQPVTSDERRTIQHATVAMQSIATLAYLGGQPAKDWLRSSLGSVGQPRTLFSIASNALPRRNGAVSQECLDLASGALSLLSELLTDASMPYHVEAVECFASSSSDTFSQREDSVISSFLSGGIQNNVTLSTMSIISTLARWSLQLSDHDEGFR